MNKTDFQLLSLEDQVNYINECMRSGKSLGGTCKEIGISKSISEKFKKYGYVLTDNQYVSNQSDGQESILNNPTKPQESQKTASNINVSTEVKEADISQNEATAEDIIRELDKDRGRPKKENKTKTNLSLDQDLKREAQIYCLRTGITLSDLVEKLLKDYIESDK